LYDSMQYIHIYIVYIYIYTHESYILFTVYTHILTINNYFH
jgi:hypothetical protein